MLPNFTTGLIAHSQTVYCGPADAAPADLTQRHDFALPDPAGTHQRVSVAFAGRRLRRDQDIYASGLALFAHFLATEADGGAEQVAA